MTTAFEQSGADLVVAYWPSPVPEAAYRGLPNPAALRRAVRRETFARDSVLIERCEHARGTATAAAAWLGVLRRSWSRWKGGIAPVPEYVRRSMLAHLRVVELEASAEARST